MKMAKKFGIGNVGLALFLIVGGSNVAMGEDPDPSKGPEACKDFILSKAYEILDHQNNLFVKNLSPEARARWQEAGLVLGVAGMGCTAKTVALSPKLLKRNAAELSKAKDAVKAASIRNRFVDYAIEQKKAAGNINFDNRAMLSEFENRLDSAEKSFYQKNSALREEMEAIAGQDVKTIEAAENQLLKGEISCLKSEISAGKASRAKNLKVYKHGGVFLASGIMTYLIFQQYSKSKSFEPLSQDLKLKQAEETKRVQDLSEHAPFIAGNLVGGELYDMLLGKDVNNLATDDTADKVDRAVVEEQICALATNEKEIFSKYMESAKISAETVAKKNAEEANSMNKAQIKARFFADASDSKASPKPSKKKAKPVGMGGAVKS